MYFGCISDFSEIGDISDGISDGISDAFWIFTGLKKIIKQSK